MYICILMLVRASQCVILLMSHSCAVCLCIYLQIHVYRHISIYTYICLYVYMYIIHTHLLTCIHTHTCIHTYTHTIAVCMNMTRTEVNVHACIQLCMRTDIRTYMYTSTDTSAYMHCTPSRCVACSRSPKGMGPQRARAAQRAVTTGALEASVSNSL